MSNKKRLKIIHLILLLCDANGTLIVFPKDSNVTAGDEVRFPCSTDTHKSVIWQYGKQLDRMADVYIGGEGLVRPYSKSNRHSMDEDSTTGRYDLIISSVTKDDEGVYVCSERGSRDTPSHARLTVTGVDGSYSNYRDDVVVVIYSKVSLKFTKCLWGPFYVDHVGVGKSHSDDVYNKNKLLNEYAHSGRFGFDDSSGMCQLLIMDIQEKDAGTYTCREDSGLGKRCDIELIVIDGNPDCAINANATDVLSKASSTMELSCKVNFTGHREPVLEWKHNNDSQLNQMLSIKGREAQSKLIVDSDTVEKNCGYVCEIGNSNRDSNESLRCFPSNDLCHEIETSEDHSTPVVIIAVSIIVCLVIIIIIILLIIFNFCRTREPLTTVTGEESLRLNRHRDRIV